MKTNFFFKKWKKKQAYKVNNINLEKKVKLIFFENRKIIRLFFKKKSIKKQNKLNIYIMNYLNKNSFNILNTFEFKLYNILIKSHFFNNINDSIFFIKKGYILINNNIIVDPNYKIKLYDFIKLLDKTNYYLYYRNSLNNAILHSKKINWAFQKFRKKNKTRKIFPKVYNWITFSKYFGFDIPYYIDVDFINMTAFILIKSFDINNLDYSNIKFLNLYLTRLYNWNYIV